MDATLWLAGAAGALTCLGAWESWLHQRFLGRVPIRVHVNGARGKSSVTRLIAAGLRAGGLRTCAKTTGTLPRMIFPDGSEYPVFRPTRSNIIEQLRIVRAAAEAGAEALVIECMALQPMLQSLCELKIVQSTHGVITNVRPDHLEVMGPTVPDVARALAGTVPQGGKLFTAERKYRFHPPPSGPAIGVASLWASTIGDVQYRHGRGDERVRLHRACRKRGAGAQASARTWGLIGKRRCGACGKRFRTAVC